VTIVVLWSCLIISASIPNELIKENMVSSLYTYSNVEPFEITQEQQLNSTADHYADTILLNIAWNMGVGDSITSSIDTKYYDGEELGENIGLYYTVIEGVEPNTDYTRYWHGNSIFIRILHLFTDVEGIKTIGLVTLCILIIITMIMLHKHLGIALCLLLSLIAVHFWNIQLALEYQPAFIITFLLIPVYLYLEKKNDHYLSYLSVISGVSIAFFDFLTTETMTILLPLAIVFAVRYKENRLGTLKETILKIIQYGMIWGISYIATFITKWSLATIITGTNAFTSALSSVGERVSGDLSNFAESPDTFLSAPLANIMMLWGGPVRVDYIRILVNVSLTLLILFSIWYLFRSKKFHKDITMILLFLGGIVFIRYLLLNNHSYLHCFFTYRAMITVIFTLLTSLSLNISFKEEQR
ncbi:MAG: hypothetical protein IKL88_07225, partial [Erysipelotrichales bacterium]|nr:hypothetical protein [Erysipelotrichales bacterium]